MSTHGPERQNDATAPEFRHHALHRGDRVTVTNKNSFMFSEAGTVEHIDEGGIRVLLQDGTVSWFAFDELAVERVALAPGDRVQHKGSGALGVVAAGEVSPIKGVQQVPVQWSGRDTIALVPEHHLQIPDGTHPGPLPGDETPGGGEVPLQPPLPPGNGVSSSSGFAVGGYFDQSDPANIPDLSDLGERPPTLIAVPEVARKVIANGLGIPQDVVDNTFDEVLAEARRQENAIVALDRYDQLRTAALALADAVADEVRHGQNMRLQVALREFRAVAS